MSFDFFKYLLGSKEISVIMKSKNNSADVQVRLHERLLIWIMNIVAGAIVAVAILYFAISLTVLFFKITGKLTNGSMFFEMQTPTYEELFQFQAICVVVISACIMVRKVFGHKSDFEFIRKKLRRGSFN